MPVGKNNSDANKFYTPVNTGDTFKRQSGVTWQFWKKKRYIVCVLGFFGFFNVYALRSNISIALVDMTSLKNHTLENGTIIQEKDFNWESFQLGYVLSAFFYGYILTQILGGYLATKFGGAKIFGIGIAATAVFTLITPWAAKTNFYFLMVIRILEGLAEGVNYPASLAIWAKWAPPLEKTRLTTICISGTFVGTVVAMPVSSFLASYLGWESIFYVFGGFAVFWYAIWLIVVKDSPSGDSRIDPDELIYINETINATKCTSKPVVPWRSLLTTKAVWATAIALSCENWGFHTLVAFLPQMMKSALNFDLNKSGALSALPYIAMTITMQLGGYLSDRIIEKQFMTVTNVRKSVVFIGFICQSVCLFSAANWISPTVTPTFVVLGATFGGLALSGIPVNALDIAPQFASVILGISNTCGTIPGIVSPILTGYIVTDLRNIDQWKIVFYIASGIYFVGALIGLIFMSGEEQTWAKTQDSVDLSY